VTVYLVGAGPGDPGLLTRRGAELLARCDVVVYDRLAEASLLELAPAGAERIDVGKRPGGPVDQDSINRLLVDAGRAGRCVVRLKGGDPFVFGRGGEEAQALAAAGVTFEIVPGVSSAVAAPAYAGVPVTQRGVASSFTVVTGHSRHDPDPEPDWEALARVGGTIVVLMGVAHRDRIAARLMAGGLAPDTPALSVLWGTRPDQETVRTTLGGLAAAAIVPPATIVIGAAAGLALDWFERRPLFGRRVVVTRAAERAGALSARLAEAGAEVVEVATISAAEPSDGGEMLRAVAERLSTFRWVVLTSPTGVERLFSCLHDARDLGPARVAAVGPGTAAALAARGVVADLVSPSPSGAGLADAMPGAPAGPAVAVLPSADPPPAVLLARAEVAGRDLPALLAGKGWIVVEVPAYRTVPVPVAPDVLARARDADVITFASASAVEAYLAAAGPDAVPKLVVCIGPTTAAAARDAGLEVAAVAARPTVEALVEAVVDVGTLRG
jgi:uroporphyrinogen III methyltransferase/synthase